MLARWHVDAARCEAFLDRAASQPGSAPDDRMIRRPVPPAGVDVIIGERSVQVGDNFQFTYSELRDVGFAAGPPPWLDFHMAYFRRHGPPLPGIIRVPMAEGVEDDVARVLEHHRAVLAARGARRSLVQRHPVRVRNIALGVAAACGVAVAAGWLLRHDRAVGEIALLAMVVGVMVGLAALLLGVIAALTATRR